jgi:predicted double-glycine peptidase
MEWMAIHLVWVLYLQGIKKFVADSLSRPFNGQTKLKTEDEETESLVICISNKDTHYNVVKAIHQSNKYLHPEIAGT